MKPKEKSKREKLNESDRHSIIAHIQQAITNWYNLWLWWKFSTAAPLTKTNKCNATISQSVQLLKQVLNEDRQSMDEKKKITPESSIEWWNVCIVQCAWGMRRWMRIKRAIETCVSVTDRFQLSTYSLVFHLRWKM